MKVKIILVTVLIFMLLGCNPNLKKRRRIVFYNTESDKYFCKIVGHFTINSINVDRLFEVRLKTGDNSFKKITFRENWDLVYAIEQLNDSDSLKYKDGVTFNLNL